LPLPTGYDPAADAKAQIDAALAASAKDHREVLVDFGANWCPDCRVLEKLFADPEVAPLLQQRFRVVPVDVGNWDHNLDLAAAYRLDLRTSGIPALVVIGADGKVRHVTNDGAFSNARTMDPSQVAAFLAQWSGASGQ
jgi:thiol:disulfide interchange protein